MGSTSNERLRGIREQLQQDSGILDQLPSLERRIVQAVLNDQDVHQIAQEHRMSEAAVWNILGNAARIASGRTQARSESAGFGSDMDRGVTGGYGDTGFGSIGNEPPIVAPEEPDNRTE